MHTAATSHAIVWHFFVSDTLWKPCDLRSHLWTTRRTSCLLSLPLQGGTVLGCDSLSCLHSRIAAVSTRSDLRPDCQHCWASKFIQCIGNAVTAEILTTGGLPCFMVGQPSTNTYLTYLHGSVMTPPHTTRHTLKTLRTATRILLQLQKGPHILAGYHITKIILHL